VWPLLLASTLTFAALFGIDAGYYLHLGFGQWHLIWDQQPIADVISSEKTDPHTRDRLRLSEEIRAFAIEKLGLEGSDNYTTFSDIGDGPVVWALTVCEPDKLEPHRWSYPVIGSAPYRGFFDRERGDREQQRFEALGFDTYLRGVSAFSTLGWFRDPLLSSVLKYPALDLADVIIHELTHATIWIEGDADFNESLATFIGREGAKEWMLTQPGGVDSLATTERRRTDQDTYRQLMHGLATRLDSIYSLDIPRTDKLELKEIVIAAGREESASMLWKTKGYESFGTWRINNATLGLFRTYNRKSDVFDRVLKAAGSVKTALRVFETSEGSRDPEANLERWLEKHAASE
jgi:predicted aminopeptidase